MLPRLHQFQTQVGALQGKGRSDGASRRLAFSRAAGVRWSDFSRRGAFHDRLRLIGLLLIALLNPGLASAVGESGDEAWSWAVFGTVSAARVNRQDVVFLPYSTQPNGAGEAWTAKLDSLLGVQLRHAVSADWSATLQLTSRRDHENANRPDLEWAYFSYQPIHEIDLRMGRFVAPLFAVSDTRLVGYANLWVRPPVDVYTLGINRVDGVDLNWRQALGAGTARAQLWGGSHRQLMPVGGQGQILNNREVLYRDMVGLNLLWERAGFSVRAGHFQARQSFFSANGTVARSAGLFGDSEVACLARSVDRRAGVRCRDIYEGFEALEQSYDLDRARFSFSSFGLAMESGAFRLLGELVWMRNRSRIPDSRAVYLTLARVIGSVTPYITLSAHDAPAKQFSASVIPAYAGLVKPALTAYQPSALVGARQRGQGAGLRWDLAPGLDIKAQVDRMQSLGRGNGVAGIGNAGLYRRGNTQSAPVIVFSLALDFAY